ncbi:MAG: hypothetical protein UV38_C0002G0293 [candidate division TM6 bacterium GW2011_GWE2_42_60]|nr:MAG: hypothetical protein UV38_C0002G0293 [candidate division TM6 bacterium GW2011_GWE2_42_60]
MKKNIWVGLLGTLLLIQWVPMAYPNADEIILLPQIYKWFLGPQKKQVVTVTSRVFPLLYYICLNKQIKKNAQQDVDIFCTDAEELSVGSYLGTRSATSFVIKASSTSGAVTFEPLTNNITLSAVSAGTVSFDPASGTISLNQSVATTSAPTFTGVTLANQGQLKLYEATGGGTNFAAIQAPAALGADYTLTLPTTAGTNGYALTTNGSGVLSWSPFASGSYFANGGNSFGRITIANSAGSGLVTVPSALYADGGIDVTATGGTDVLNLGVTNADTINLGTATTTQLINIGTGAGVTTINIGGAGDTVNVGGTLTWVKTTDLEVTDKLITINKGGVAASGNGAGIQVEEDVTGTPTITGYIKTSSDRKSWQLVAPVQAYIATLAPLGANFTISSPSTGSFFSGSGAVNVAASGINNTGIGAGAGGVVSVGTDNTACGYNALSSATSGTYNTAIGSGALSAAGIGSNNTAVGRASLSSLATGEYNTAVGASALAVANFSNYNSAFGYNAGAAVTTGLGNVFVGDSAGAAITSGTSNVFIGSSAGSLHTTSDSNNICIGYNVVGVAGESNIVRIGRTSNLICYIAGSTLSTPSTGSFFSGSGTVNIAASGINNTGIGASAGGAISSGTQNTSVGSGALSAVATGTNNIGIGYNAGSGYTSSEANNICIGATVAGTAAESNIIRLGNLSHTVVYITGISTVSVGASGNLVGITTGHQLGTSATTWSLTGNLSATGNALFTNTAVPTDLRLTGNSAGTASDWSILSGYGGTDNIAILEQGVNTQFMINTGGRTAIGQGVTPDGTYRLKVADTATGYGSIMIGDAASGNAVLQTISAATDYLKIGFTGAGSQLDTLRVTRTGDLSVNTSTIIYRDGSTPYIHHTGSVTPITNVFVGDNAGNTSITTSALSNSGFGVGALLSLSSGSYNTACGRNALGAVTTTSENTAVGYDALKLSTGSQLTAVGAYALDANLAGVGSAAVGCYALTTNTTGNYNVAVGLNAMNLNLSGANNVAVGSAALYTNSTGSANTAIGAGALLNTTVSNQTAVGFYALNLASTGTGNTAVGYFALQQCTTGTNNTALGYNTLISCTGSENTAVGANALDAAVTASYNTAFGYNALTSFVPTVGGENTALGHRSGEALTTGVQNIFVGGASGLLTTTGARNTCVGYLAAGNADVGSDNTGVGNRTLLNSTAGQLTAVGSYALDANTSGTCNTAVGYNALTAITTSVDNTAVGHGAGAALTTNGCTFVGRSAGVAVSTGGNNTFIGAYTGSTTVTGQHNVALGYYALGQATSSYSASYNTAIGNYVLQLNQSGLGNTAVGYFSLNALTTGATNVALGNNAGQYLTTGSNNILIGYLAGNSYTSSEVNNIIIGDQNVGVIGESNIIRIQGGGSAHTACYIDGIYNAGGVPSGIAVYCGSNHQLSATTSSIRFKENVQEIPSNKRATDLHPVSFNYKNCKDELWYGLIAEEVETIMPELVVYDDEHLPFSVKYQHVPILLLKEVKELLSVVEDLKARIAALEAKLS